MLKTLQEKYIDADIKVLIENGVLSEDMSVEKQYIINAFIVDMFKKELGTYVKAIVTREKEYKEDHAETRIVVNCGKAKE